MVLVWFGLNCYAWLTDYDRLLSDLIGETAAEAPDVIVHEFI